MSSGCTFWVQTRHLKIQVVVAYNPNVKWVTKSLWIQLYFVSSIFCHIYLSVSLWPILQDIIYTDGTEILKQITLNLIDWSLISTSRGPPRGVLDPDFPWKNRPYPEILFKFFDFCSRLSTLSKKVIIEQLPKKVYKNIIGA